MNPLPLYLTPLIGREQACIDLTDLLQRASVRLLTLNGSGGVGKTRLACAVVHTVRKSFPDGICFVPLSSIHDHVQVWPAIIQALGIQGAPQAADELLQTYLCEKRILLLLDNFEQVVEAAPQLVPLLSACPGLTILVTSRETLRIEGEQEFHVRPLPVPDLTTSHEHTQWQENPAIALFVERARAISFDFRLTTANVQTIAQICIRLDGLPLALELAAARIKLLPPQALLARLTQSLNLLTTGRRDAPPRQQTLRRTIQWSYDLLSANEQLLFQRLAIFIDGCTLSTLETFYQSLDGDEAELIDGIASLLQKNLLLPADHDEEQPRLRMLETLREFGLECAQTSDEWPRVQLAYAHYYLDFAEKGCKALFGKAQRDWLKLFLHEQGNLRVLMQRCQQNQEESALVARLGAALGTYWLFLGMNRQHTYLVEGVRFLQYTLEVSPDQSSDIYIRSLIAYGGLLISLGEAERGVTYCQQGLELSRRAGSIQGIIYSLWMVFLFPLKSGNFLQARQLIEEAIALARAHPEHCPEWGAAFTLGFSLHLAGIVALCQRHLAQARIWFEESIQWCREAGEDTVIVWSQIYLGEVAIFENREREARILLEQGLSQARNYDMFLYVVEGLNYLGLVELRTGSLAQARLRLQESLHINEESVKDISNLMRSHIWLAGVSIAQEDFAEACRLLDDGLNIALRIQDQWFIAQGLEGLVMVAIAWKKWHWAARLLAAAEEIRIAIDGLRSPRDQALYDKQVTTVCETLGSQKFKLAWKQGQQMNPQQVIQERSSIEEEPITSVNRSAVSVTTLGLTRRECDTLAWLMKGLTNAQIADQMVVTTMTVNSHLRSIYSKLGVTSRTLAVRFIHDNQINLDG